MRKVDIPLVDWQPCAKLFKGYATITGSETALRSNS